MNLVGKIFVVVIAVFSVVFMSFSVAVYATHKSWKDEVMEPQTGLNAQLKDEQTRNTQLKEELAEKESRISTPKDGAAGGPGQAGE